VAGLIDPSTSLDTSEVANDETAQFLNTTLVNNPTIAFPDYTLGLAYEYNYSPSYSVIAVLGSSNGLADNPNASYSQLVDITDNGKGVFAGFENQWHMTSIRFALGGWVNSADHEKLNGSGHTESNYGLYTTIDGNWRRAVWNLRLGFANDKVSRAEDFQSVSVEYPFVQAAIGAGFSRTGISGKTVSANEADATYTSEVYLRFRANDKFTVTPSIQWMKDVDISGDVLRKKHNLAILSLRLSHQF